MSATTFGLPPQARDYLLRVGVQEPPALSALRQATEEQLPDWSMMISSPEQAAFLAWLTRIIGARKCIEIGTFTGFNAVSMALALPDDGVVTCCDISKEYTDIGRPFWESAGVSSKIDLRIGPAMDTLDALLAEGAAGTFDVAFIDADKSGYCLYFERSVELVRRGGVIAVDNVLWSGRVADPDNNDASTVAIRALNDMVAQDPRVDRVMLPLGDGLLLARVL